MKEQTHNIQPRFFGAVGSESDAVAYRRAMVWDGESPTRFDDVYATAKKIKGLSDKEISSLFTLEEVV